MNSNATRLQIVTRITSSSLGFPEAASGRDRVLKVVSAELTLIIAAKNSSNLDLLSESPLRASASAAIIVHILGHASSRVLNEFLQGLSTLLGC
jgi:hypothetical protein